MTWSELDWASLNRHREHFLGGAACDGPYWTSETDLASYDLTFGERIGWKWDAVLDELQIRGWRPRGGPVLDWGCGSGIAGRRVIGRFGQGSFESLVVWDHSPLAAGFAHDRALTEFPGLSVAAATAGYIRGAEPVGLLLISHVLNELKPQAVDELRALIGRARAVIWTEPGSRDTSRALGSLRDEFAGRFGIVAPCTHGGPCPILAPGNERHWCHHFAAPPPGIFADSNWVKFGRRAGIDLRSLPYAFMALDRDWTGPVGGLSRVIGRPEHFKPYVRLLNCDKDGLAEMMVMKRDNPGLCKELEKAKLPLVYKWETTGNRITAGSLPHPRS